MDFLHGLFNAQIVNTGLLTLFLYRSFLRKKMLQPQAAEFESRPTTRPDSVLNNVL